MKRKILKPDNIFDYISITPRERDHESGYKTLIIHGYKYNPEINDYNRFLLSNKNIDNVKIISKKIKNLEITVDFKDVKTTIISALHNHVFYLDEYRQKITGETATFKLIKKNE
ncbi:MAG: hypothetical protein ACFFG0_08105 [Candidatus Thorarchaeota archaeon]